MKLIRSEPKGTKRDKASGVLQQEQEPQGFFDYERDVPATIRSEFEQSMVENKSGLLLPLSKVLHRPDLLQAMAELVPNQDLNRYFFEELSSEENDAADAEAPQGFLSECDVAERRFDLMVFFSGQPSQLLKERLNHEFSHPLSPKNVTHYGDDPDEALSKLFVAYKFFPEYRAAYQEIAEERFSQFLNFCLENREKVARWRGVANALRKMWFLCPNFRPQMEQFAQELRHKFLSIETTETDNSSYAAMIFTLTLIAKHEAEITPEGQYVFKPKRGPSPQPQPLPQRSHI